MERLITIPETEERLVLATGRFIGEGFDDARLDTLFLAMPVSWKGTLVQYAGRLHRRHHAKTEVRVMDYVDRNVPMLARMFEKRMKGYRAMGYSVALHGQAEQTQDDYVIEYDPEENPRPQHPHRDDDYVIDYDPNADLDPETEPEPDPDSFSPHAVRHVEDDDFL